MDDLNVFDTVLAMKRRSEQVQNEMKHSAATMARLLQGNLRHVPSHVLTNLKRELRDFNMHTGSWKPLGGED